MKKLEHTVGVLQLFFFYIYEIPVVWAPCPGVI